MLNDIALFIRLMMTAYNFIILDIILPLLIHPDLLPITPAILLRFPHKRFNICLILILVCGPGVIVGAFRVDPDLTESGRVAGIVQSVGHLGGDDLVVAAGDVEDWGGNLRCELDGSPVIGQNECLELGQVGEEHVGHVVDGGERVFKDEAVDKERLFLTHGLESVGSDGTSQRSAQDEKTAAICVVRGEVFHHESHDCLCVEF